MTPGIDYRRDQNRNLIKDDEGRPIPVGGVTITLGGTDCRSIVPGTASSSISDQGETQSRTEVDDAARTVLAALGLCAAALVAEAGLDLRSRCLLWPTAPLSWELLGKPGVKEEGVTLEADEAIKLLKAAVDVATSTQSGCRGARDPLRLVPSDDLVRLVVKSQQLAGTGRRRRRVMPGLTIGWEYLTGYCVATDPASRQRAEWPPHPGRVFMALAAAWFETGEDADEGQRPAMARKAGRPQMSLPPKDEVSHREVVTVFVPVNDRAGPSAALIAIGPSITRSKQPRTFPVRVGRRIVRAFCIGPMPNCEVDTHRSALDRLCRKVTRIGHSSSLVRMWLAEDAASAGESEVWVPEEGLAEFQVRRVSEGTLNLLDRQFNRRGREEQDRLTSEIASLAARKKTIRGRGASEQQKAAIDRQIELLRERLKSIDSSLPIRPKLGLWSGYRRQEAVSATASTHRFRQRPIDSNPKQWPAPASRFDARCYPGSSQYSDEVIAGSNHRRPGLAATSRQVNPFAMVSSIWPSFRSRLSVATTPTAISWGSPWPFRVGCPAKNGGKPWDQCSWTPPRAKPSDVSCNWARWVFGR